MTRKKILIGRTLMSPRPEKYHVVHQKRDPKYRQTFYDRKHYDIFMLDLRGTLTYSVLLMWMEITMLLKTSSRCKPKGLLEWSLTK